jgi:hypothetical protein
MSWSFLCSGSSVRMIDGCLFCRCRCGCCVQGVKMIDDCLFGSCGGLSCVQGVVLR